MMPLLLLSIGIVQRGTARIVIAHHATVPLHGRRSLTRAAHSSSILHLQPSCASTHTQHATQHATPHNRAALQTILHNPSPLHLNVTPQRGTQERKSKRGKRENARVQGTGEQDGNGKWGTGTPPPPRDLGSTLAPVISVGSGYPNPKILGVLPSHTCNRPPTPELARLGSSKAPPPAGVAGPAPRSYSRSRCG